MNTQSRILRRFRSLSTSLKFNAARRVATWMKGSGFRLQEEMDISPYSLRDKGEFTGKYGGMLPVCNSPQRALCDLAPLDGTRRDMLFLLLKDLVQRNVEGDLVEAGVYQGQTAELIRRYMPERPLHLFDTFTGFDSKQVSSEISLGGVVKGRHFSDVSVDQIKRRLGDVTNVRFYQGLFPDTVTSEFRSRKLAFVHFDLDLYEPTLAGLELLYEQVVPGGAILVHDYCSWIGARRAVEEFSTRRNVRVIPMPDKCGSALIPVF